MPAEGIDEDARPENGPDQYELLYMVSVLSRYLNLHSASQLCISFRGWNGGTDPTLSNQCFRENDRSMATELPPTCP